MSDLDKYGTLWHDSHKLGTWVKPKEEVTSRCTWIWRTGKKRDRLVQCDMQGYDANAGLCAHHGSIEWSRRNR